MSDEREFPSEDLEARKKTRALAARIEHLYETDEGFRDWIDEGFAQVERGEVIIFDENGWRCDDITGKLPPALIKALGDPFDYALGLRDGRIIRFCEARLVSGNKWVHLTGHDEDNANGSIEMPNSEHTFPRGIDIRLSDIMWVADAPDGS